MTRPLFPCLVVLGCCLAPPARGDELPPRQPAQARRATLEKAGYTPVPFTIDNLLPYAEGTVGGEKVRFFVDSGNQATILDRKVARKLMLPLGAEMASAGVAGPGLGRETHLPALTVGPFDAGKHTPKIVAVAADLSVWPRVPGVLGADFLDAWGAVIDYPARTLYLRPALKAQPDAPPPAADPLRDLLVNDGYTRVPLERDPAGARVVAARVGSYDLRLMVDTGANVSVFDAPGVDKLGAKRFGRTEIKGFGGTAPTERISVRGLTLGGYDTRRAWSEQYAGSADLSPINQAMAEQKRQPIAGMFGGLGLLNGSAVIDFAGNALYLKTARDAAAPRLEGKWLGVSYEQEGRKESMTPDNWTLEFKRDRFTSTQQGKALEWRYHLEDLGDRFRVGLFKTDVDELTDGFKYHTGALIKPDGDALLLAWSPGANRPLPTEFAAPRGSGTMLVEFRRAK